MKILKGTDKGGGGKVSCSCDPAVLGVEKGDTDLPPHLPPSFLPKAIFKIQQAKKHFSTPSFLSSLGATPAPTF